MCPRRRRRLALAETLRGEVGGFKVGKELFTAAGPDVVRALVAKGDRVFLDLKYHDIPNTVAGAVRSASELGVWMLNVHASGGRPMMEAARRAADDYGAKPGCTAPLVIAVTVLTSLDAATLASVGVAASPLDQVVMLARLAQSRAPGWRGGVTARNCGDPSGLRPRLSDCHARHPRRRRLVRARRSAADADAGGGGRGGEFVSRCRQADYGRAGPRGCRSQDR